MLIYREGTPIYPYTPIDNDKSCILVGVRVSGFKVDDSDNSVKRCNPVWVKIVRCTPILNFLTPILF